MATIRGLMSSRLRRAVTLALVAALVLAAAACGGDGGSGTTEPITFGEGEIPSTVPDDFPIPAGAVIGTTLVDRVNNRTEFRLTVRADPTSTTQFFEVGLVNQGYVVGSSEGNQVQWAIEFSRGELTGSILLTAPQNDLTAAVVSLATS